MLSALFINTFVNINAPPLWRGMITTSVYFSPSRSEPVHEFREDDVGDAEASDENDVPGGDDLQQQPGDAEQVTGERRAECDGLRHKCQQRRQRRRRKFYFGRWYI